MFLNILLNLASVYFICSVFENLFLFFIICFALIVLNCEILSLFSAFYCQNIIILSAVEFVVSFLIWFKLKKKFYFPSFDKTFLNVFKLDKSLVVFGIFFLLMLFGFFVVASYAPPLEPDSRMYHFVRIFQYIKQASFSHFLTNEVRNILMPFNSELVYSYFFIFKKTDTGFGLLSYFSFIFALFGIYKIFYHIKIPKRKAMFAIFSLSAFGPVLVQIPSLQTDVLTASFILASLALFMDYFKTEKKYLCYFSSLSYALALGVKTTAIILSLSFVIIIFSYIKIKKIKFSKIGLFFLYFVLNFLIFSSYNYILNYIQFGDFISNDILKLEHKNVLNTRNLIYNTVYFINDFIGFKIGFLAKVLAKIKIAIITAVGLQDNNPVKVYFDERTVGFSFAGIFIYLPCLIRSFFIKNRRYFFVKMCSLTFIINFLIIDFIFLYSFYIIRYFVSFFLISSFCLVFGYKNKIYKTFIVILLSSNLLLYTFYSSRCPLRYFFGLNLLNRSETVEKIILQKQKDRQVRFQYKLSKEFQKKFDKKDKIALLNDDGFYELKKLSALGYDINFLTSDYIYEKDISDFDYIFLIKKQGKYIQKSDNFDNDEMYKTYKNNYKCTYYAERKGEELNSVMKTCEFGSDLLKEKGFGFFGNINVENKYVDIYKKLP